MSDPKLVAESPQDRERRLAETPVVESTQPIDIKTFLNVYEFETTLTGSGEVIKFKPVTTGQMKKMLAYEQSDSPEEIEQALDELITDCVISPDFDIDELYLQDRFGLLLDIRRNTKGDGYNFQWKCPVCSLPQPASTTISSLEVVETKETETLIDISDNLQASFVFPTRGVQRKASEVVKALGKMSDTERQYEMGLYMYSMCMITFHTPIGKTQPSLEDKYHVINNSGIAVLEKIKEWMTQNDFGVAFSVDVKCTNQECEFEHNMEIPVTDFFV
jgi:hypothetical protein